MYVIKYKDMGVILLRISNEMVELRANTYTLNKLKSVFFFVTCAFTV